MSKITRVRRGKCALHTHIQLFNKYNAVDDDAVWCDGGWYLLLCCCIPFVNRHTLQLSDVVKYLYAGKLQSSEWILRFFTHIRKQEAKQIANMWVCALAYVCERVHRHEKKNRSMLGGHWILTFFIFYSPLSSHLGPTTPKKHASNAICLRLFNMTKLFVCSRL